MSSNLLIALLFFIALVSASNPGINTGAAFYALRFPDSGQASVTLPESLSQNLPLTFSFEAWVMLPGTVGNNTVSTADGLYKTIVSRYSVRPDGTYNNMFADFNLQIQKNGDINFFMGSGMAPSFYGVIITASTLQAGVWTHLAFSVYTPVGKTNPQNITLFVDGQAIPGTWKVGSRQLYEDVPIHIGAYMNQDGDVKWWRGYLDEIRFWATDLSTDDVKSNMAITIDPSTPNLLAYYKCDSGAVLIDATPHHYDGQFVAAAGAIQYDISGVKLGFEVDAARDTQVLITLVGVGTAPFSYVIESIPDPSVGLLKVGALTLFTDTLPYLLSGNTVTFVASDTEGQAGSFTYYGTNSGGREANSTRVDLTVERTACKPDACGVCGGDNSSCACLPVPYMGYTTSQLDEMLLLYELEESLSLLEQIEMHLEQTSDAVDDNDLNANLDSTMSDVQDFHDVCLTQLHDNLSAFLDDLSK